MQCDLYFTYIILFLLCLSSLSLSLSLSISACAQAAVSFSFGRPKAPFFACKTGSKLIRTLFCSLLWFFVAIITVVLEVICYLGHVKKCNVNNTTQNAQKLAILISEVQKFSGEGALFKLLFKLFVCVFNFVLPLVVNKDVQKSLLPLLWSTVHELQNT